MTSQVHNYGVLECRQYIQNPVLMVVEDLRLFYYRHLCTRSSNSKRKLDDITNAQIRTRNRLITSPTLEGEPA